MLLDKNTDTTVGMGNKVARLSASAKTLIVDDTVYKLTPCLLMLITNKHP